MNRRVARTDEKGTQEYLYGNLDSPFQVTGVRKSSGDLDVYHYDESGLLVAMQRDASWYYVVTDQLGSPQVVGDVDGGVVKVLEYDSFGKQVVDSDRAFDLPINFAGGLIENDTNLVNFWFRDYDPVSGKWNAKDPIGFMGSDVNLYRYVGNNSINLTDPLGLNPLIEALAQTGGDCCGPKHDCWQKGVEFEKKCYDPNTLTQNQICIIHDYMLHKLAVQTGDLDIWKKADRPEVMAIQEFGCKYSTNWVVKLGLCHEADKGKKLRKEQERQQIQKFGENNPELWNQVTEGPRLHFIP
jgi:RHS repeat-associated protein